MRDWPPIDDPELLRRLAASDADFVALMRGLHRRPSAAREFGDEEFERALGYPWPRPPSSFLLDGDDVELVEAWDEVSHAGSLAAARVRLQRRARDADPQVRAPAAASSSGCRCSRATCTTSTSAPRATPPPTASFPATLFVSPGTALRAAVLFVTPEQLTALTWTEVSYRLGRLDGVRFEPDVPGSPRVDHVLAFSSRWGSHCVDGEVAALAALPARGRTVPEFTQERAARAPGRARRSAPARRARDLVAWIFEDFAAAAERIAPLTQAGRPAVRLRALDAYPACRSAARGVEVPVAEPVDAEPRRAGLLRGAPVGAGASPRRCGRRRPSPTPARPATPRGRGHRPSTYASTRP